MFCRTCEIENRDNEEKYSFGTQKYYILVASIETCFVYIETLLENHKYFFW